MLYDAATTDRIYHLFLQEAPEFLEVIEQGLLNISQGGDLRELNHLMRAAHSIKGCAASVGLHVIEQIAHQLEDVFCALAHRQLPIDSELEELLLRAYDCLQMPMQQAIDKNNSPTHTVSEAITWSSASKSIHSTETGDWISHAQPIFDQLKVLLAPEMAQQDTLSMPSIESLGIDIVEVIFTGDVAQGIQHLISLLKAEPEVLTSELRVQAEVFVGVGELTNLPGFRSIAAAVLKALDRHPELVSTINQIAIRDFRAAHEAVLAGDRIQGGMISDRLKQLISDPASPELNIQKTTVQSKLEAKLEANEPVAPVLSTVLRVDRHRFDRLSAHIGDLVTYENSEQLQQKQLNTILQSIHYRIEQFEKIQATLKIMSEEDNSHNIIHHSVKSKQQKPFPQNEQSISAAFITQVLSDPLQFDTYSPLQNLTQTATEELACLKEVVQDLVLLSEKKQKQQRQKLQTLHQTENDLLWIRMLPIEQILQRFPRMVRDLCIQHQKNARINLLGSATLIDKAVLEKLFDPLVHLVRNAFDHGVETPQRRESQGKPQQATIEIKAYHRGNLTYVEIRDDGNGIDLEMIKAKAINMGFTTSDQAAKLKDEEILEFIFAPGFSTAIQVSELSGRGVGLDSVRQNLRSLKGDVQVFSEPTQGTMFRLTFPLTLTIADLLIFQIHNRLFSITVDSLSEILVTDRSQIEIVDQRSFYRDGDELIPIAKPDILLEHYPLPHTIDTQLPTIDLPRTGDIPLLLIEIADEIIALPVDKIIQRQEQVIKPFNNFVPLPEYLYGCTVFSNGELIPVLDSHAFIHQQKWRTAVQTRQAYPEKQNPPATQPITPPTLLVVDDTLTMRELLSYSLTQLGFRCLSARDGREALQVLEQASGEVIGVFTDLEMPVMNGFEFIQECRSHHAKDQLPIIVLSSRNGQKHRELAQQLGANEYLTKPFLEHQLIQVLTTCDVVPPAILDRSNLS